MPECLESHQLVKHITTDTAAKSVIKAYSLNKSLESYGKDYIQSVYLDGTGVDIDTEKSIDTNTNPFSWIYAMICDCKSGEQIRISTCFDGDYTSWYLLEEAMKQGVKVDIQVDSLYRPIDQVRDKIEALKALFPDQFTYKQGKSLKGGMRHSKIYATARWIAVGSFNMSQESREVHQESGFVSNIPKLVSEQHQFLDKISL